MGVRERPGAVMDWQSTLAMMRAHGTVVVRSCSRCGLWGELDLDQAERELGGADMSLWDCRPPCALCGGAMHHLAGLAGTPRRPLLSQPGDSDEHPLPPQAWMAGWRGRRWW